MLAKKFRLTELEVKKVLRKWKPFFSYSIVLNYMKNDKEHNRFAIVIGSSSTSGSIDRNFFRRRFYDRVATNVLTRSNNNFFDLVFVVKKSTLLSTNDDKSERDFCSQIDFLIKKYTNNER